MNSFEDKGRCLSTPCDCGGFFLGFGGGVQMGGMKHTSSLCGPCDTKGRFTSPPNRLTNLLDEVEYLAKSIFTHDMRSSVELAMIREMLFDLVDDYRGAQ